MTKENQTCTEEILNKYEEENHNIVMESVVQN